MTAPIVRRLIPSLDAAMPMLMPNLSVLARYALRLWWWIWAMRLIRGTGMHRINHEAPIHHAKRRIPFGRAVRGVMAVMS